MTHIGASSCRISPCFSSTVCSVRKAVHKCYCGTVTKGYWGRDNLRKEEHGITETVSGEGRTTVLTTGGLDHTNYWTSKLPPPTRIPQSSYDTPLVHSLPRLSSKLPPKNAALQTCSKLRHRGALPNTKPSPNAQFVPSVTYCQQSYYHHFTFSTLQKLYLVSAYLNQKDERGLPENLRNNELFCVPTTTTTTTTMRCHSVVESSSAHRQRSYSK